MGAEDFLGSILGGLGGLGTGIAGEIISGQQRAQEMELLKQIQQQYSNIPLPELQQMVAEQLGPTAVGQLNTGGRAADLQSQALETLQNIAQTHGMDAIGEQQINEALQRSAQQNQGAQAGILDSFAQRGQLGSGNQLAAQLHASQSMANQNNQNALGVAAQRQQRGLDALLAQGRMAGDVRGQNWGENLTKAQAEDDRQQRNAAYRNQAQQYNLGLNQQRFNNAMTKQNAMSGAAGNVANAYGQSAQDTQNFYGNLGGAFAKAGQGVDYARRDSRPASSPDDWENPYRRPNGGY